MEALQENVEWTEVIKVLTPFSGGIYRERKIFAGLLRPADYVRNIEVLQIFVRNIEVPTSPTSSLSRLFWQGYHTIPAR
jgi:hypothetical protein